MSNNCPYCGADEPAWNGTMADPEWHDLVHKQDAEIERLRAALQKIADLDPMTQDVLTDDVGPMARAIAIRALKSDRRG